MPVISATWEALGEESSFEAFPGKGRAKPYMKNK
jgi:hypothetical protein